MRFNEIYSEAEEEDEEEQTMENGKQMYDDSPKDSQPVAVPIEDGTLSEPPVSVDAANRNDSKETTAT